MRKVGFLLSGLVAAASMVNLGAQRPPSGSALEAWMGRWGFLDESHLAEEAYRGRWAGNLQGPDGAVRDAERALAADQASPYRWCDLGETLIETHARERARYCLERAVERGPMAPQILMRAANGYFLLGDFDPALACTGRILSLAGVYDQIIFSTWRRMGIDTGRALDHGLPPSDARPAREFLLYSIQHGSLEDVRKAWRWAVARGLVDDASANQYILTLVRARRYDEAVDAWASYLGPRGDRGNHNLLFNGGFEHDPYGVVFDWNIRPVQGVQAGRDPATAYAGRASLRIRFDGSENVSYENASQAAVVEPGAYRLEARVRTENITTDQGVALRVFDREDARRLNEVTTALVGTTNWALVAKDFTVAPPTRLIQIEVVRDPSSRFDSAIGGTAWIDDVRLVHR